MISNAKPHPKKRLGQHFLISPYYAEKIADSIACSDDRSVVEIGPGMGAVSVYLKRRFPRFHLIEMDRDVIPALKVKLGPGEWVLHAEDVLRFDFGTLGSGLHIIGNLPYNIGAMIIKKTLFCAPQVASVTYMVQREVAERIVAGAHTKQNGFLSIFCQFFGKPQILFHVPPGAFFPKPNVESSVFQLAVRPGIIERLTREEWEDFFALVSRGFTMRRKMLLTSLSWKKGNKAVVEDILRKAGLDAKVRPEDLLVDDWIRVYKQCKDAVA